jgi:pimeloyl-ACP methyl ester carboxylesterase
MATYALIHGGGDSGWAWHLVVDALRAHGHDALAPDLPIEDPEAGLWDYADAVGAAVGDREDLIVVGHSLGAFTAPLVCARTPARRLVLIAGMVPAPGETASEWWTTSGYATAERERYDDDMELFYHDVPPALAAEAKTHWRDQTEKAMEEPWPLGAWPEVPTSYLLCRDDRLLPAGWVRRMVSERLGIAADELDGGHCPFLSRPEELAERLHGYR